MSYNDLISSVGDSEHPSMGNNPSTVCGSGSSHSRQRLRPGAIISAYSGVVNRSARLLDTAERAVPSLLTMSKNAGYLLGFNTFLTAVGIVTQGTGVLTEFLQTR